MVRMMDSIASAFLQPSYIASVILIEANACVPDVVDAR